MSDDTCELNACGRSGLEREIARLGGELDEQRDLSRIAQKGWDDCNRRNEQWLVLLQAERLLRKAVEEERDRFRVVCKKVQAECDAIAAELGRLRSRAAGFVSPWGIVCREVTEMLNIKERIRRAVYQCFPEVDPEAGAKSWVDTMLGQLSLLRSDVTGLVPLVRGLSQQKRYGTVVLLPPAEFKGLKFLSQTVAVSGYVSSSGMEIQARFENLGFALPAGGWVIAHGCQLSDVFVGNQSQTKAPGGEFCQITDPVPLGVQLHARVRFD